ncbi:MAG: cell wall hydrolase [Sphingomicrobium sp.]
MVAVAKATLGKATLANATLANATLATVSIPELIDPNGKPTLAIPQPANPLAGPLSMDVPDTPPPAAARGDLGAMVAQLRATEAGGRELECLAIGIYFESKGEPLAGQLAVGKVIANRAKSRGRFPSTYCGVLLQPGQFSFVHGHALPTVGRSSRPWQTAVAIARIVDQRLQESSVGNALFFHARRVSPGWGLKRVAAIGNHIFYR